MARVRPTALETMAQAGDVRAQSALRITRRLDQFLTAAQLGITLASLALGWLGEPALAGMIEPPLREAGFSSAAIHGIAFTLAFVFISLLHVVVGEQTPKIFAVIRPVTVARLSARPLIIFYYALYPVIIALTAFSNYLLRGGGLRDEHSLEHRLSPKELRLIVKASFKNDKKEGTKRELLERVLRATDRPVRVLMVPRIDIVTLSLEANLDEWLKPFASPVTVVIR